MKIFVAKFHHCHASVALHSEACGKVADHKGDRVEGETWRDARDNVRAALYNHGRDDVAITICPCAKKML